MGQDLFVKDDLFRDWMVRLDDIAVRCSGTSVIGALYSDAYSKGDVFDCTLLTHPAIFMVEYALAQTLIHKQIMPDMVLGASLGSFAAAAVAGFVEVADALTAVIRQASILEECCEPGGMTAVLAEPQRFSEEFFLGRSELAAVNFSSHFVVSAKRAELAEIEATLKRLKITYQRLPVSFAFHSQWIEKAKAPFESFIQAIQCKQGRLPLVCCDQTTILLHLSPDYFWNVVRHQIRFPEAVARLEEHGPRRYIDVGPAGTLATFLKYGMPATSKSTVHTILTPFGLDHKNLSALCGSIRN
jgi:acyl transferase domain-containing protein